MRGATHFRDFSKAAEKFQSTLLVRGATGMPLNCHNQVTWISIHAPRERSDYKLLKPSSESYISIHAPRERSDVNLSRNQLVTLLFQSTLLVRGATLICSFCESLNRFQSTLLVRGATKQLKSKHAQILFQSTLLVRGATHRLCY